MFRGARLLPRLLFRTNLSLPTNKGDLIGRLWRLRQQSTESVPSQAIEPKKPTTSFATRLLLLTSVAGLGIAAAVNQNEKMVRFMRAATCCAIVSADYKWSFRNADPDEPEYSVIQARVHQRSANRLLKLCKKNGGCYVKLAQYIASLNHVLPSEYTTTLAVLQDKAPYMPIESVEKVFLEELHCKPDDMFIEFNPIPVAAASLAQVHQARLKTGEEVAVKIQYLGLSERVIGDLASLKILAQPVGWLFPKFEFGWAIPEFEQDMMMELDFMNEGKNSERIARNFAKNKHLKIPMVYWDKTTKKILTMEWCTGVKISDAEGIKELGLNVKEVAIIFTEIFSEQIFVHGFVHSDPHPGNIFVRIKPGSKRIPEIILLDHGLCKEIPSKVRIPYCRLWKAIVLQNQPEIEKQARLLGAGDFHMLFRFILTFRSENPKNNIKLTQDEKSQLKAQFKEDNNIVKILLKSIPIELLLVLKTQALIRSTNHQLGVGINRFIIMARYSVIGAAEQLRSKSLFAKLSSFHELMVFDFMLRLYALGMWMSLVWGKFLSLFGADYNNVSKMA